MECLHFDGQQYQLQNLIIVSQYNYSLINIHIFIQHSFLHLDIVSENECLPQKITFVQYFSKCTPKERPTSHFWQNTVMTSWWLFLLAHTLQVCCNYPSNLDCTALLES